MKIIIILYLIKAIVSQDNSTTTLSESDPYCVNGIISKNVCCYSGCGQCGESGCSDESGLIGDQCCINNIRDNGRSCDDHVAPCIIADDKVPPEETPEPESTEVRLSLFFIIMIIVGTVVLCLFVNTGSNRKYKKFGHLETQRNIFTGNEDEIENREKN